MNDLTKDWRTNDEQITVDRLNAEIERLKGENHRLSSDPYQQKLLQSELQHLAKDREIARLNEENGHFAWRDKDKNALITALADALDLFLGKPSRTKHDQQYRDLIQRAREAVTR